jgi:pentatricopeptide repeat protein
MMLSPVCVSQAGQFNEFFSFFEEMRNTGVMPNVPIYNMAIHFAAKNAQIEKAYALPALCSISVSTANACLIARCTTRVMASRAGST